MDLNESGHRKPETQNMFVDVVMEVIVSVIGVELPKVTLHLLSFVSFDLWMFRVCVVLLLSKCSLSVFVLFVRIIFFCVKNSFPKLFGW